MRFSNAPTKVFATVLAYWRSWKNYQKQLIILGLLGAIFITISLLVYLGASDHLEFLKYTASIFLINAALFLVVFRQAHTIGSVMLLSLFVINVITAAYYLVFYFGPGI